MDGPRERSLARPALERRSFLEAFAREIEPQLTELGFGGADGHLVRAIGDVEQVVEIQLSIYGTRVTMNLALDLAWLAPVIRWVTESAVGPRAHDCPRWVRLGVSGTYGRDHWWSFDTHDALRATVHEMRRELLGPGLEWLERESSAAAFLTDARARVERSRGPRHPHGRFLELRLLAAVLAWNGRGGEARDAAEKARAVWPAEKARLDKALALYRDRYPPDAAPPGVVPDLPAELDALLDARVRANRR